MSTTIYDGKLTAWLELAIDVVLVPVLPVEGKLYEGVNTFEIKRQPALAETRRKLVAIAREYEARQRSGQYERPATALGEVDHGCND